MGCLVALGKARSTCEDRVRRAGGGTGRGDDLVRQRRNRRGQNDDRREPAKLKVDFVKPFEGTSMSEFAFKPEGAGTAVTWTMSAHHNFLEKAFCLVMNGKKLVGDAMEKGLDKM